jgi:hypothetical protein
VRDEPADSCRRVAGPIPRASSIRLGRVLVEGRFGVRPCHSFQEGSESHATTLYRGANIDTWILNVKGDLPEALGEALDRLKGLSQEADEDVPTPWTFDGQTLFIKAHGSGRQWRWILHCPSLHLDIGRGRLNHIVGKARLAAAFLWEHGPDIALTALFDFLVTLYGEDFSLQVSEVHLCADVAGWELSLEDAGAFITRGHNRTTHVEGDDTDDNAGEAFVAPTFEVNMTGRRCTGYEFSKGAAHSCCLYDKTKEITVSRKDWMRAVWERNGWDGQAQVTRVEFRYKRECLRELGVEEAYDFLDQLPGLWAYSSAQWLRHTVPTSDTNRGRWEASPLWRAIQEADFFGRGVPAVRERRRVGELKLICQMLAGCSITAAAYLTGQLPNTDNGADFLTWFYDWMEDYHRDKGLTFREVRDSKRLQLGVVAPVASTAA